VFFKGRSAFAVWNQVRCKSRNGVFEKPFHFLTVFRWPNARAIARGGHVATRPGDRWQTGYTEIPVLTLTRGPAFATVAVSLTDARCKA
jgi:hypothetical protein